MQKEHSQPGAWAVIYCSATGKFLMGKRSSKVNKGGAWNLFGGRIDDGERPREALVRELDEEAGLNVKLRHLAKLHTATRRLRSGDVERDMHYYVIQADREFSPRLNREHSDFRWFKATQLPSRFNEPTWVAIKKGLLQKVARH
ncbi:NUDIX hydrolase [Propionivibrio sp.]|uniref:NUDIX hydrolase n=1 Tax=Propionivibrio sp. TaxID=2212460 RepID=UPI003BF02780